MIQVVERGEYMPTTYTHYRFGKEVLEALPRRIRTAIEKNREIFDIGLHGPDILFYYHALIPNAVSGQGYGMHRKQADSFLENVTIRQAKQALFGMDFCHKALYAPGKMKRSLVFGAMKAVRQYERFHGLVMSLQANPECREYCLLLKKLYESAIAVAVDLIMKYQNYLLGTAELPERFCCTFGAGDKWEELVL